MTGLSPIVFHVSNVLEKLKARFSSRYVVQLFQRRDILTYYCNVIQFLWKLTFRSELGGASASDLGRKRRGNNKEKQLTSGKSVGSHLFKVFRNVYHEAYYPVNDTCETFFTTNIGFEWSEHDYFIQMFSLLVSHHQRICKIDLCSLCWKMAFCRNWSYSGTKFCEILTLFTNHSFFFVLLIQ